jgi:hypothetical protein
MTVFGSGSWLPGLVHSLEHCVLRIALPRSDANPFHHAFRLARERGEEIVALAVGNAALPGLVHSVEHCPPYALLRRRECGLIMSFALRGTGEDILVAWNSRGQS